VGPKIRAWLVATASNWLGVIAVGAVNSKKSKSLRPAQAEVYLEAMSDWLEFFSLTPLPYILIPIWIRKAVIGKKQRQESVEFADELTRKMQLPRVVGWIGSMPIHADMHESGWPFLIYRGEEHPFPEEFISVEIDAWNITRHESIVLLRSRIELI
jgi:hypothetical protein